MRYFFCFCFSLFAAEIVDVGVITNSEGLKIHKCHTNDASFIEVIHIGQHASQYHGNFTVTNQILFLEELSMIPTGTNLFQIRTICAGSTSEVVSVKFVIRRPIPSPKIEKIEKNPKIDYPPFPPGMVQPLPRGANISYEQFQLRFKNEISEGKRRSQ